MAVSIDSNLLLSSKQQGEVSSGSNTLGKDDFLKLLMVQLQNQDPTNTMDNTEFISQMATFSSLEQMTNMNASIEKLVQAETQSSLISYSQFVGKEVTWHMVSQSDEQEEPTVTSGKGAVQTVQFTGDSVKLVLEDGTELTPANISEVNNMEIETPLIRASSMIGKMVTWMVGETEYTDTVKEVAQKNGLITLVTAGGNAIKTKQIIKIS